MPEEHKTRYRLFKDTQFIALVLVNGLFILLYEKNLQQASTIILAYYLQSVLIGLFHFIRLLAIRNTGQPQTLKGKISAKGTALFFAFHYGLFHFVYFIFLIPMLSHIPGRVDIQLLGATLLGLFIGTVAETRKHIQRDRVHPPIEGLLFFQPYLRVIPMHIFIILAFINFQPETFLYFLLLKAASDIITYIIIRPRKPVEGIKNF